MKSTNRTLQIQARTIKVECTLSLRWRRSFKIWRKVQDIRMLFRDSISSSKLIQTTIGKSPWPRKVFNWLPRLIRILKSLERVLLRCHSITILVSLEITQLRVLRTSLVKWAYRKECNKLERNKMSWITLWISRMHSRIKWIA